jgi:hypothetical protein
MALVNPNIAMSFRQPEITPRNALAEYAQLQQIQGGQRQAELADMQIQRIRQTDEALESVRQIAMKNGGPSDLNEIAKAYLGAPNQEMQQFGLGLLQKMRERSDFENTYKKLYPDTAAAAPTNAMASAGTPAPAPAPAAPASSMGQLGTGTFGITPSAPMNAMAPAAPAPAAPVNALAAPTGKTADQLRREIMLFSQSADPRAKAMVDVLKGQLTEMTKPFVVGRSLVTGTGTPIYQAPESQTDLMRNYAAAQQQGFTGSMFDYERQIKMAGRAPVQPVAPTITQIVDPRNPNQMITIDARRYTGGSVGSPGVLGVGGKEPSAAVRENKAEAGKTQLADDLDNLRASFTRLDEMRAIPSTARNPLSNIASATAATGIGQTAGRFVGTEAQVEREVINSARTRLVNSIKNATGMSAQQLNSNVELQTMLKSISDPGQPIEAALRIIDDIDNAYVKGAGMSKKKSPAAPAPASQGGPSVSNW